MNKIITQENIDSPYTWKFMKNIFLKGCLLFILINLLFPLFDTEVTFGKLSLYNLILPGRLRFPFGEVPQKSYNLSLYNLDGMFASHEIARDINESNDDYRIFIIGDSSVWGTLLKPEDTITGKLNIMDLGRCNGKTIKFYNLGYPTISLTKDLMILEEAIKYKPDLVVWLVTLEAFPSDKQLTSPLVAHNAERIKKVIEKYNLPLNPSDNSLIKSNFWDKTIIGKRRELADLFRLQLYGILWAATGIDQIYPEEYEHAQRNLQNDESFHNWDSTRINEELSFKYLEVGIEEISKTPVILVNEPIMISSGINSYIRYNYFYPRWIYDQYRTLLKKYAFERSWDYRDLWNLIPEEEYTNSAIHLTPSGSNQLAIQIGVEIKNNYCQ